MPANDNILRVYDRVYVAPDQLANLLNAYQAFHGVTATLHFAMPERNMHVIALESDRVNFSVVSAPPDILAPLLDTGQTILVRDAELALRQIVEAGGAVRQPVTAVPPGFQARGQLPGAPIIEFAVWTEAAAAYRNPDLSQLRSGMSW